MRASLYIHLRVYIWATFATVLYSPCSLTIALKTYSFPFWPPVSSTNCLAGRFIDIIRTRGNTLFELLREVCNSKQEQLDKKNEVLLHLGSQADHCITVVEAVLTTSSDMALLYSKK